MPTLTRRRPSQMWSPAALWWFPGAKTTTSSLPLKPRVERARFRGLRLPGSSDRCLICKFPPWPRAPP
jgi:hypothetical protein